VVYAAFEALLHGQGFVGAGDDDDYFTGLSHSQLGEFGWGGEIGCTYIKDGLHADCEGHLGDFAEVIAEEARVGQDCFVGECLDASAAAEARARLVEGYVTVLWSSMSAKNR